ncbi:MAG: twin-arginine translocase TatA/TatE family subunit [Acidimicrobiales bacterium]
MGGLDPSKIFLILVIVLIIVGPERLPGAARQLGGMWRELNRMREKVEQEIRSAVPDIDLSKIPTSPSQAITGYLTGLVSGQTEASLDSVATSADTSAGESVAATERPRYVAASRRASWHGEYHQDHAQSTRQSLLGGQHPTSARRPPSVPSSSPSNALSADTVFVFDEPSMN